MIYHVGPLERETLTLKQPLPNTPGRGLDGVDLGDLDLQELPLKSSGAVLHPGTLLAMFRNKSLITPPTPPQQTKLISYDRKLKPASCDQKPQI